MTPEEILENLEPYLEAEWGSGEDLEYAKARMLGRPQRSHIETAAFGEGQPTVELEIRREATGLHRYGDSHMQAGWDGIALAIEEIVDALNILGPLTEHRIDLAFEYRIDPGLEKPDPKRGENVLLALGCLRKAYRLLRELRPIKHDEEGLK